MLKRGEISLAPPRGDVFKHNIYQPGVGYRTDHIPDGVRRNSGNHWDDQYQECTTFENSWKPRTGPLEFVSNLTKQKGLGVKVLNMGAGLGDFTVDLAAIPNVFVYHVDFSQQGNNVAHEKVVKKNLQDRVEIHTTDNDIFLQEFYQNQNLADIIFFYGASGSNEPSDIAYAKTMKLASRALNNSGFVWHVTLLQPRLDNFNDFRIQDVLGDFPKAPNMPRKVMTDAGLILVREMTEERPDFHPLEPGGNPVEHLHMVYRGLFKKPHALDVPFSFKDALNSSWKQ